MYGSHDILNFLVTKHLLQHWMHHTAGLFLRIAQAADWKNAELLLQEIYLRYFADVLSV